MKRLLVVATVCAAAAAGAAQAKTFRWASQGDPQTADPHSQNEGLTNLMAQQVYGTLVMRDKRLGLAPGLAESWTRVNDTTWRFNLRRGARFSDGTPFTADDVVFSIERAQHPNSQLRQYSNLLGKATRIDDYTVELTQKDPNPILLEHATTIFIMSKAWSVKHKVERPLDYKSGEDSHAARHAMGAGPWMLVTREPDVKTVLKRNPYWWGKFEGNVTEIVYMPIRSEATRTAALFSGQVDFVLDPPVQDIARIKANKELKVVEGTENRVVFLGFDQQRDELLYSNVKGKNPFKDKRVRQAVYQAIDVQALHSKIMRGLSAPTGGITPSILASNPEAEKRRPYDPNAAKKLLVDAGYPNGFEVGMNCPNNRYINDEAICTAVVGMLGRIGITVKLTTQPRATYFPRLEKYDTSFFMLGWGGAITDAQTMLSPVLRSYDKASGQGSVNYGRYLDPKLDALIDGAAREMDAEKRKELIRQAIAQHNDNIYNVPLHRQVIPWAMRANVHVVHRADNWLIGEWVSVGDGNGR